MITQYWKEILVGVLFVAVFGIQAWMWNSLNSREVEDRATITQVVSFLTQAVQNAQNTQTPQ